MGGGFGCVWLGFGALGLGFGVLGTFVWLDLAVFGFALVPVASFETNPFCRNSRIVKPPTCRSGVGLQLLSLGGGCQLFGFEFPQLIDALRTARNQYIVRVSKSLGIQLPSQKVQKTF